MSGLATGRNGRPQRIALFGHFGSLNTGNESTLIAMLARLREALPDAELLCICTDPDTVAARDGIAAVRITPPPSTGQAEAARAPRPLGRLNDEVRQSVRAFRLLRGTDTLIVPGTGLLTDAFGLGAWGPANLFRWVAMARLRGARVAFVSVGAGPLTSTRGQLLVRAALSLASYRSYRDAASRDCLTRIGFPAAADPIYPDLVFDLPATLLPPPRAGVEHGRRTVGLGLMLYPGRYSATAPDPATHDRYLSALIELVAWLIEHGYAIRLLFGDGDGDPGVVAEFQSLLSAHLGSDANEHVVERPLTSVKDVVTELAATDVVVATRFHNVLLALLLGKPVLAISFHHKCSSLMQRMQLSEYCHEIHEIDATKLIAQFQALERDSASVGQRIEAGVREARAELAEQYERLLNETGSTGRLTRHLHRALHGDLEGELLALTERGWRRLPERAREHAPLRACGYHIHARVRRRARREMYLGTLFLRNRPTLELMRRLVQDRDAGTPLRITVLGCSIGVEVYSILWTLRSSRPDLEIVVNALDISAEAVRVGERGRYGAEAASVAGWPIFAGLSDDERAAMFDWDGDAGQVKPWLREGIRWQVGDAADPALSELLGPQDLVVANNFLCHMEPVAAERCLRNLAGLVASDGYLFVAGVDLDVRTRVARELGWAPVAEMRAEAHDGDALVLADWPWRWWGLEPLDRRRPDWETRYSAAFRFTEARVPVKL